MMKRPKSVEQVCLYGHLISMMFGLAGLLWVMPHPEILDYLPAGPELFKLSMAGGGVVYILLGALAVGLYGWRAIGWRPLLGFMLPAVGISLTAELLGTSTGWPFGDYTYLNGLGYKIGELVPFTIPLSWFYLGFSSFLLAQGGLSRLRLLSSSPKLLAIANVCVGALLLMSWDFVLDPAMSQTAMPFWYWHQPGAFFGMPYQNFAGWFGTGAVFMTVAFLIWQRLPQVVLPTTQTELMFPLVVYLGNFVFATVMSLGAGFIWPILLGLLTGAAPAVALWKLAPTSEEMPGEPAAIAQPPALVPTSAPIEAASK